MTKSVEDVRDALDKQIASEAAAVVTGRDVRPVRTQPGDYFEADGRTAWMHRNGTRTQKRMFETEAECAAWVRKMNG